jgi:hypothetical protein
MGVISLHKFSLAFFIFLGNEISSGARPALPMGVAPEAILESFFGYRLQVYFFPLQYLVAIHFSQ